MKKIVETKIKELEDYIGFLIERPETSIDSYEPVDDRFSYGLCQRFYGKKEELELAIKKTTELIVKLIKFKGGDVFFENKAVLFYSLLGDMYYIRSDFDKSINCFMKALSCNKKDITNWAGLIFSFRSYGEINLFEDIIFNFEKICRYWEKDSSKEMNKKKIFELVEKVKKA